MEKNVTNQKEQIDASRFKALYMFYRSISYMKDNGEVIIFPALDKRGGYYLGFNRKNNLGDKITDSEGN